VFSISQEPIQKENNTQKENTIKILELPVNKDIIKLPVNKDIIELPVNNDIIEILKLPQNNIEKKCEDGKIELASNHPKTISEYEQIFKRMEKFLWRSEKSRKTMVIQMRKMKTKLKRL